MNQSSLSQKEQHKFDDIALVLQGGGALGAYQAGVYQVLAEHNIEPTWVAGISIGALNTAIIAGNPPEKRVPQLKAFWQAICSQPKPAMPFNFLNPFAISMDDYTRKLINGLEANKTMMHGQSKFFVPKFMNLMPYKQFEKSTPDQISYYDTSKLKETLLQFADFDLINNGPMRVTLGVVNVKSGEFSYFDNDKEILRPEHFMASGALPPAFPAIEIDGQFYWDGGIVNNTPISQVIHENKTKNTLIFQVDLWNPEGTLPQNFNDISTRTKDIQFSSRTNNVNEAIVEHHEHIDMLKHLLANIPDDIKKTDPWCLKAAKLTQKGVLEVVHLIYQNKNYETNSKDYEFSSLTMKEHWVSGLNDMDEKMKNIDPSQCITVNQYNKQLNTLKYDEDNISPSSSDLELHKYSLPTLYK